MRLFARRGVTGERKRLGLLGTCLIASIFCLLTGTTLFEFSASAQTEEPAQTVVVDEHIPSETSGTGEAHEEAAADHHGETPADHPTDDSAAHHGEEEGGGHGGHSDPVAPVLLWLVIILASAKLGGDLFDRMGQPAVLGELLAGVLIGNALYWFGVDFITVLREGTTLFDVADMMAVGDSASNALSTAFLGDADMVSRFTPMADSHTLSGHIQLSRHLDIFSRVGVIILLFMVGLESNIQEMMQVGVTSFVVAIVGVVAPFLLGFGSSYLLLSDATVYVHLFIGATLCATSVGITARVFKDLKKLHTKEAKIILGAAVIDDVLGLIILAVVQGLIVAADSPASDVNLSIEILKIVILSIIFLGGAIVVGVKATPWLTKIVSKMRVPGMKLVYSLLFALLLSWLADVVGLASIVGAFAAGLVLDEVHFKDFKGTPHRLEELIEPIAAFLVPVFFVLMGIQVKLETFADVSILGLALGLTVAALIGKQVCGAVVRDPAISKMSIGFGMIPRGEVGLIFAAIGKSLTFNGEPIIDSGTFSAVVIMVILTTLATPPLLKWSLSKNYPDDDGPPPEEEPATAH